MVTLEKPSLSSDKKQVELSHELVTRKLSTLGICPHTPQKHYVFHKSVIQKNEDICTRICNIRTHQLRYDSGLYVASPDKYYRFAWTRDCLNVTFPYLGSDESVKTIHALLDKFRNDEVNIDKIIESPQGRDYYEHPHPKFSAKTGKNVHSASNPWGFVQNDAIGLFLKNIGLTVQLSRYDVIRNEKDLEIIQKLINYLVAISYSTFFDNGIWEEQLKLNASSISNVVKGLEKIKEMQGRLDYISDSMNSKVKINVPKEAINSGKMALKNIFSDLDKNELNPIETPGTIENLKREDDLSLLLLPVIGMADKEFTKKIINNTEKNLLRERGVIRYKKDMYYNSSRNLEEYPKEVKVNSEDINRLEGYEAEWTMGLPYLSINCELVAREAEKENNREEAALYHQKALNYLRRSEAVMTVEGFPELYYAKTNIPNKNHPLGWSNSAYVLAVKFIKGKINYLKLEENLKDYLTKKGE